MACVDMTQVIFIFVRFCPTIVPPFGSSALIQADSKRWIVGLLRRSFRIKFGPSLNPQLHYINPGPLLGRAGHIGWEGAGMAFNEFGE